MGKDSCVGFVANIKGVPSREIMTDAYHINSRMDHRGGCGFEENTGDGAALWAIPHKFFQDIAADLGIILPKVGSYAVGNLFLPNDLEKRNRCKARLTDLIEQAGLQSLGFREVPIAPEIADVGPRRVTRCPLLNKSL